MQMDGLPGELSSYPRSDSPSGLPFVEWRVRGTTVIPMGSWGYVARRSTMVRWAGQEL
ncbi:putative sucrose-phosphate synthase 1 [Dorcoceras hygrometricum]|uniref:Putative sucrose-phosphate synthase 1 n=1 Tax=Dorcoceras hygrometricum TaxID=472368 RepID=A0A2Z7CJ17_9LAMI|nr:putative sucrose-phosphate synthase 1 [Dorcoceras hygrometricum]